MTEKGDHGLSAATLLNSSWGRGEKIPGLPDDVRPSSRQDGYRIAQDIAHSRNEDVTGWKIAATSKAGQSHINVDGPLAGRLYQSRVLSSGKTVSLGRNLMKVAEVEFAFRFGAEMRPIGREYTVDDVMNAVATLHLSIEIPDSRYQDFTKVGAPSLIADTACADWLVLGPEVQTKWRDIDLAAFAVEGHKNGQIIATGTGRAALGDPRLALTWLVNELCRYENGVNSGSYVTTGTCVVPVPIAAGDHFVADYGILGQIDVTIRP
jgi:2-keto-4-pentenoate hydratase